MFLVTTRLGVTRPLASRRLTTIDPSWRPHDRSGRSFSRRCHKRWSEMEEERVCDWISSIFGIGVMSELVKRPGIILGNEVKIWRVKRPGIILVNDVENRRVERPDDTWGNHSEYWRVSKTKIETKKLTSFSVMLVVPWVKVMVLSESVMNGCFFLVSGINPQLNMPLS